jgi:sec-independent protein translocase protein TatA
MFHNLGPTEMLLILLVVVLLFGAKKLPDLARGAGQGLRIFKDEVKGEDEKPEALEQGTSVESPEKKPEQQG